MNKPIEGVLLTPDTVIEQKIQSQKESEYKLMGSVRLNKGMKLFSFNIKSGELGEVKPVRSVMVGIDSKPIYTNRANFNKDCYYIPAINIKNAERKIKKRLGL